MKNNTKRKNNVTRKNCGQSNFIKALNRLLQGTKVSKNKKYNRKSYTKNKRDGGGDFKGTKEDYTPLTQRDVNEGYFSKSKSEERLVTSDNLNVGRALFLGNGSTCSVHEGICKIRTKTTNDKIIVRSLNNSLELNPEIFENAISNATKVSDSLILSEIKKRHFDTIVGPLNKGSDTRLKELLPAFQIIYPDEFEDKEADMRMAIKLYDKNIGPALYMCGVLFDSECTVKKGKRSCFFFRKKTTKRTIITANIFDISQRVKVVEGEMITTYLELTILMLTKLGEDFCNADVKPGNLGLRSETYDDYTIVLLDPGTGFNIPDVAITKVLQKLGLSAWNIAAYRTKIMEYLYYVYIIINEKYKYLDIKDAFEIVINYPYQPGTNISGNKTVRDVIIELCLEPGTKILHVINNYHWIGYGNNVLTRINAVTKKSIESRLTPNNTITTLLQKSY